MRATPGDTIAAISTSLGPGAIAVVRLSGEGALSVADAVFRGAKPLADCRSHTVHLGRIVDGDGREVDEVLAAVFLSPNTYTTEHMIEFSCHGGSLPARRVLAVCLDAGARLARRGEFTERAFLNGRLDLIQAEAVADIVSARTREGLSMALGQLEGSLSGKLVDVREAILNLRADVEALIDFPEEGVREGTLSSLTTLAGRACEQIERLLVNCEMGMAVRDGVSVAIVGKPNVGKSSIMNALLERDRSIVTSLPGTTRDAIEECLHVEGVPIRLIDTAGWREGVDEAEVAGVRRAIEAARGASLTLLVVDASRALDEEDAAIGGSLEATRTIVAGNKVDIGKGASRADLAGVVRSSDGGQAAGVVFVSAKEGDGLDGLRSLLVRSCEGSDDAPAQVTNERHVDALKKALCYLHTAERLIAEGSPAELVASEIEGATSALGEITGETTPEQVLERIFERFCVGK